MREIRSPLDGILSPFAARAGVPAFSPSSLFASGEDGAWYDPSDTTSLYQSLTGGDYADTDGDVVGIMLDKSQMGGSTAAAFIAAQPEKITNGSFDADSDWTKGTGWTITGGVAAFDGLTGFSSLTQINIAPVGEYIEVAFHVTSKGSNVSSVRIVLGGVYAGEVSISSGVGSYSGVFKNTGGSADFALQSNSGTSGANDAFTLDNVSVKQIPGNHAVAPSDAARPLYKTAGGLHWLEFDGVDDYLVATVNGLSSTTVNALAFNPGADTAYIATSLSSSIYWHYTQIGNPGGFDSGVGSPSYRLNGADIVYTNRGDTHSNWANNDNISIVQNLNLPSTASFYLFNYATFSGLYTQGKMYGALLLDRALTTDELADLESYLAAKSGVTL